MCLGIGCGGQNVLQRSEAADLRQLANLVGRVFQVPIAYAAMLGRPDRVMTRIGSGGAYWKYLRSYPLLQMLAVPQFMYGEQGELPPGTDLGPLKFAASAPIVTLCGQRLGILVIADLSPRPGFSDEDLETLVELAAIIACRMELRMVALQATESESHFVEAEERFRMIANSVQALIACNGPDGLCDFVNEAWSRFTGRHSQDELGDGWQQVLQPDCRDEILNQYWRALQTQKSFTAAIPLRRSDGVYRRMQCNGIPRFFKDRTFAGFLFYLTDLSDSMDNVSLGL